MKSYIKEIPVEPSIDWNEVQLVIHAKEKFVVLTTSIHTDKTFEGMSLSGEWVAIVQTNRLKSEFELFQGEITLKS